MVKRQKSPDIPDDSKYFVVHQPYPNNTNWDLLADRKRCAFWIASIIGQKYLIAHHYKPKARGMVILEVHKSCPDSNNLLGEHRWNEFLYKPAPEEREKVSQIFFAVYNSSRAAQKDGWKCLDIEAKWFEDWEPINSMIRYPYPRPHWCLTPAEDRTNKSICRPIPGAVIPRPPGDPTHVVGSNEWIESKGTNASQTPQTKAQAVKAPQPKNALNIKPNAMSKPTTSASSASSSASRGPAKPSPWAINAPHASNIIRGAAPPAQAQSLCLPTPPPTASSSPLIPPGLTKHTNSTSPTSPPPPPSSTTISSLTQSFSEKVTLSPSMERELHPALHLYECEEDDENAGQEADLELMVLAPWERSAASADQQAWVPTPAAGEKEEVVESLWGDEDTGRDKVEQLFCPTHGIICKKGICRDMARLVKEKEREASGRGGARGRGGGANGRGGQQRGGKYNASVSSYNNSKNNSNSNSNSGGSASGGDDDGFEPVKAKSRGGSAWGRGGNVSASRNGGGSVAGSSRGWNQNWD